MGSGLFSSTSVVNPTGVKSVVCMVIVLEANVTPILDGRCGASLALGKLHLAAGYGKVDSLK